MASAVQAGVDALVDDEVISRILAGERELFAAVIQRYSRRLYRIALSILRDPAEAEDVVQDAFVSAFLNLGQVSNRARFVSWLSRIAVNYALSRIPSRNREVSLDAGDDLPPECLLTSVSPSPEERASARESSAGLYRALAALSERHRMVLILRDLNELDTRTVAKRLGTTEGAVKVRLHRARRNLRSILGAQAAARTTSVSRLGSARGTVPARWAAGRDCNYQEALT